MGRVSLTPKRTDGERTPKRREDYQHMGLHEEVGNHTFWQRQGGATGHKKSERSAERKQKVDEGKGARPRKGCESGRDAKVPLRPMFSTLASPWWKVFEENTKSLWHGQLAHKKVG